MLLLLLLLLLLVLSSSFSSSSEWSLTVAFLSFFLGYRFSQLSTADLTTSLDWLLSGPLIDTCMRDLHDETSSW